VEFDGTEQFREKVGILRESYMPSVTVASSSDDYDAVDESNEANPVELNEKMSKYVQTIGQHAGHPSATGKFRQAQLNG